MPTTVRDIAVRAKVSKTTVGYVLSGHPKKVSEEVRQRILEAAREMDYRPNENARSLAKGKSNVIGVVPFQLQRGALMSPFIRASLSALYDHAEERARHILLFTGYDAQDPAAVRARSFESRVDGLVLIAPKIGDEMLAFLADLHIPVALISSPQSGSILYCNVDNEGGIRASVDHLAELGHRQIGFLGGPPEDGNPEERLQAFLTSMAAHGLSVDPEHLARGEFNRQSGYECALRLLSLEERPTAI
ncbi:LacI family transcriptional regulator, partial [bacterium]